MLTDRDIVLRVVAEARVPETTTVWEVCTREFVTVDAMAEVEEATRLMRDRVVHRVAVVDEAGAPIGVISVEDLAACGYADPADVIETLQAIARAYRSQTSSIPGL